ncbi:MAG: hypothetical protein JST54_17875 [Deltaproteobacteria bacterium]|nr:hypothetical protein [Deltaproteobacteria bacterium]
MKIIAFRSLIVGAVVAASLTLASCSSGFSCSDKNKCTGVAPSQDQIDSCNKEVNDSACGGKLKDWLTCIDNAEVCFPDGGNNALDILTGNTCTTQSDALTSCCEQSGNANAPSCAL